MGGERGWFRAWQNIATAGWRSGGMDYALCGLGRRPGPSAAPFGTVGLGDVLGILRGLEVRVLGDGVEQNGDFAGHGRECQLAVPEGAGRRPEARTRCPSCGRDARHPDTGQDARRAGRPVVGSYRFAAKMEYPPSVASPRANALAGVRSQSVPPPYPPVPRRGITVRNDQFRMVNHDKLF